MSDYKGSRSNPLSNDAYGNLSKASPEEIIRCAKKCASEWFTYAHKFIEDGKKMRRFLFAEEGQWDLATASDRRGRGKIVFQNNVLLPIEMTIQAEQLAGNAQIIVSPSSKDTPSKDVDTVGGIVRQIAYESNSSYINSVVYKDMRELGWGSALVTAERESPKSFNIILKLKETPDTLCTFFDPNADDPNKLDGDYAGYYRSISTARLKRMYPKKNISVSSNFPLSDNVEIKTAGKDETIVLDFYYRNYFDSYLVKLEDGAEMSSKDYKKLKADAIKINLENRERYRQLVESVETMGKEKGLNQDIINAAISVIPEPDEVVVAEVVKRERYVDSKICHYLLTASDVLDTTEIPIEYMPLIYARGQETKMSSKKVPIPAMLSAVPAQQVVNICMSEMMDSVRRALGTKIIAQNDTVSAYMQEYMRPSISNLMRYDPPSGVGAGMTSGAPQVVSPPIIDQGLLMLYQQALSDVQSATGRYQENAGAQSNAISSVAIEKRQDAGNLVAGVYTEGLNQFLEAINKVVLEWMPHVYDTERTVMIMKKDGTSEYRTINQVAGEYSQDGRPIIDNAINTAKFKVKVNGGASFSSQRRAQMQFLSDFSSTDEDLKHLTSDYIVESADLPCSNELVKRLRMSGYIPADIVAEEEGKKPPKKQPDPAQMLIQEQIKNERMDRMLQAVKLLADIRDKKEQREIDKGKLAIDEDKAHADLIESMFSAIADEAKAVAETEQAYAQSGDDEIARVAQELTLTMQQNEQFLSENV